ncbi:MAG: transcription elongation factor Spt5 [Candidatus Woesearchaeota archaeon]
MTQEAKTQLYALRTTANRESQVIEFLYSNALKKGFKVYSIIHPHGMRGYVYVEAESMADAQQAAYGIPYARGILPQAVAWQEVESIFDTVKSTQEMNIQKNDIAEIISGPFKREQVKVIRIDKTKEEVVVEMLQAAVPIPITVRMDAIKVIRRDDQEE